MQNPGTICQVEQEVIKIPHFYLQVNGTENFLCSFLQFRHVRDSAALLRKIKVGK